MGDSLFPSSAVMGDWVTFLSELVAFGIGLAIVCWMVGYTVWFLIDIMRGL